MKILVLGGSGMAGHLIYNYLLKNPSYDMYYSIRTPSNDPKAITLDLTEEILTYKNLQKLKPEIVINAAGILNVEAEKRLKESIYINSLLPHKLAELGNELGFRLIHISTDCVFSGLKGSYIEADIKDGTSVYSKTKSLGEILDDRHVTIRTSIIGPELGNHSIGLFHWFMKQTGKIEGYQEVFWNGVTTLELAKAINWIMANDIAGLVHLTGTKDISKYELLLLLMEEFKKCDIEIISNKTIKNNKTLVNTRKDFLYQVKEYRPMIMELKQWMKDNPMLYRDNYILK